MRVNGKRMRDMITELVEQDPRCADDDKRLIAKVWWKQGWRDPELYNHLKSVSSPETIRRTRAKLVEDGVITPSEATTEARYQDFQNARRDLNY